MKKKEIKIIENKISSNFEELSLSELSKTKGALCIKYYYKDTLHQSCGIRIGGTKVCFGRTVVV